MRIPRNTLAKLRSKVPPGGSGARIVAYSFINGVPRIATGKTTVGTLASTLRPGPALAFPYIRRTLPMSFSGVPHTTLARRGDESRRTDVQRIQPRANHFRGLPSVSPFWTSSSVAWPDSVRSSVGGHRRKSAKILLTRYV